MALDYGFGITKEFTGDPNRQWVIRNYLSDDPYGKWVSSHPSKDSARTALVAIVATAQERS